MLHCIFLCIIGFESKVPEYLHVFQHHVPMSALHKSEFQAVLCRLANPSSLNSIIYKIKTPEVSNGRFIVKYNVLFILNGQKPLSLPESAWKPACLPSMLPHVLVEANLFSRGVRQASCRALHPYHWYRPVGGELFLYKHWVDGLHPGLHHS